MKKAMLVFLCVCLLFGSCYGAFAAVPDNTAVLKAPVQRFFKKMLPSKTALTLPAKEKEAILKKLNELLRKVEDVYSKHLPSVNKIGGEMYRYQKLHFYILRYHLPVSPEIINAIKSKINKLSRDLSEVNGLLNACQSLRKAILIKIKEINNSNFAF